MTLTTPVLRRSIKTQRAHRASPPERLWGPMGGILFGLGLAVVFFWMPPVLAILFLF